MTSPIEALNALHKSPSPWNKCPVLAAQKSHTVAWSKAFPVANVETCSALMSSVLQLPSELVSKF